MSVKNQMRVVCVVVLLASTGLATVVGLKVGAWKRSDRVQRILDGTAPAVGVTDEMLLSVTGQTRDTKCACSPCGCTENGERNIRNITFISKAIIRFREKDIADLTETVRKLRQEIADGGRRAEERRAAKEIAEMPMGPNIIRYCSIDGTLGAAAGPAANRGIAEEIEELQKQASIMHKWASLLLGDDASNIAFDPDGRCTIRSTNGGLFGIGGGRAEKN